MPEELTEKEQQQEEPVEEGELEESQKIPEEEEEDIFKPKKKKEEVSEEELAEIATVDMEKIDKIVDRMKKKYTDQGVEFEGVGGRLGELRGIIVEGTPAGVEIQTVEELKETQNPIARTFGNIYLLFKGILDPIQKQLTRFKRMEQLNYYIYSANMKISAKQFMAIALAAALVSFLVGIVVTTLFFATVETPLVTKALLSIMLPFALAAIVFSFAMMMPKRLAMQRGEQISTELPFALRHIATELKSGIGLYKTIQAVAIADYGPLSEEFARVVTEIEEGVSARDALRHLALRTQSKALSNALMHVIRALETGGNLSDIMNEIAEDVSFDLRLKVRDFSQKLNFFGVIFIFVAIVFPVIITILGMIRNSPISTGAVGFQAIPLSAQNITLIFLVIIPIILAVLVLYIRSIQPRV